jgi:autotransporter translocation and assembly factor TamB
MTARRWLRLGGLGLIGLVGLAVLAAWGVTRSTWGRSEMRQFIERQANGVLDGTLRIDGVSGSIVNGVTLTGLHFTHDGKEVFSATSATVGYSAWGLLRGRRELGAVRLVDPTFRISETRNTWDAARWVKARPTAGASAAVFLLPSVEIVNGRVFATARESTWRLPAELRELNGEMTLRFGGGTRIDIRRLAFRSAPDATGAFRALRTTGAITFAADTHLEQLRIESEGGTLTVDGRVGPGSPHPLDLHASLEKFNAVHWRPWTPLLDTIDLTADGRAAFGGNVDQLKVRAVLTTTAGNIDADTTITSTPGVVRIAGTGQLVNFDAQRVTASADWASALTGKTTFTVTGTGTPASWVSDMTLVGGPVRAFDVQTQRFDGRAHYARNVVTFDANLTAYGASGRSRGTVTVADAITIDVTGTDLRNVDPRALPADWGVMPLDALLAASAFSVRWTPGRWSANFTLEPSMVEGATFLAGTTVQLTSVPGAVTVAADGGLRTLDAQRMGRAVGLTGLDDPLFVTTLNGRMRVTGSGPDWDHVNMVAHAELVDSVAAVGASVPSATVAYTRQGHVNTAKVSGTIAGLHPEKLGASESLASTINGQTDFTAVWQDDAADIPASMVVTGTLRATPSLLAGLPIERGLVTGVWRDGAFTAERADISGGGVVMTSRGRIAISAGTSDATFEMQADDVFALQPWSGQVAHGAASAKGQLRGTFELPRVIASFSSPRFSEPDLGILERATGTLDVEFPEWFPEKMRGTLDMTAATYASETGPIGDALKVHAVFATQTHASVANVELQVGATAVRATLEADWAVETTADISALEATRGSATWRLDPSSGRLRVTTSHLSARNVTFVNGAQRITLDGQVGLAAIETGGDPADHLTARATAIDLESLQTFLGLTTLARGQVSGDASFTGHLSNPRGRINFAARDLHVDGYTMAEVGGRVDLADGGATMALTMKQPDGVQLAVDGRAPLSWLLPPGSLDPSVPSPPWDLTAISDPVDLAIFGTVTAAVTDLGGQAIVDVHVIGAADAPKLAGTIAVADGRFRVPASGTSFSNVTADIGLGADTITVRRFTAHDKHDHRLTITGQLSMDERAVKNVNVHVEADRFSIVDNAIGSIELSSLLELTGDIAHPRLVGNVEVASGRVEVDRLLRALQGDPLAFVAETDLPEDGVTLVDLRADAAAAAAAAAAKKPTASRFDTKTFLSALAVDVQIFAPDNLILRGARLKPGGRNSWSLGDLNVTVGGELQATRAPGGEPRLRGDVTTIRGSYTFESRRFEIQRGGRIRFQGEVPADPIFDVRGVREIQGVEARVDVRGRLSEPSLQLGSNLPLDEADVLSMIIFNRPVNQLGETQRADLVGAAASLAGGYVTSPLAQSLSRALDLDLLEVETVSFGQNVAPRIRVGQRLTDRLFVQLSQQFGAQSLSELTAEYQLAKYLRLKASTAQGPGSRAQRSLLQRAERFGLDLLFFFNY